MENRRLADGRIVQRQVLYLGEINASQREAWRKTEPEGATARAWARHHAGRSDRLDRLGLKLPEQPPPKITAKLAHEHRRAVPA